MAQRQRILRAGWTRCRHERNETCLQASSFPRTTPSCFATTRWKSNSIQYSKRVLNHVTTEIAAGWTVASRWRWALIDEESCWASRTTARQRCRRSGSELVTAQA